VVGVLEVHHFLVIMDLDVQQLAHWRASMGAEDQPTAGMRMHRPCPRARMLRICGRGHLPSYWHMPRIGMRQACERSPIGRPGRHVPRARETLRYAAVLFERVIFKIKKQKDCVTVWETSRGIHKFLKNIKNKTFKKSNVKNPNEQNRSKITIYVLTGIVERERERGWVSLWRIQISPRDITYEKRKCIKLQVLPDFAPEWPELQNTGPLDLSSAWTMYFNGSKRLEGADAGSFRHKATRCAMC
jgi:hypothetical protein